ncbi:MAG: hydantoinase B/oxoprolinase family protein [Anaerolineae bacterium]
MAEADPVTLAVVAGALDSAIREMTITMRRAAMSPVLAIGNDFSNAIFDGRPSMVLQGQDQPVHLGAMIFAAKGVAGYFGADLAPGDVIYHNDPLRGGSHLQDMTMYKPVFFKDELLFWTVNRGHMNETGGPVSGGYNPLAEEIWAEGLRISPVKLYDRGKRRQDVIDFLATNFRTRRQFYGDLGAQLAAVTVAERRLLRLLERYGAATVKACLAVLLNRAEAMLRAEIRAMPDGEYHGRAMIEDDGHGSGDLELRAMVRISGDEIHITWHAPSQSRSYINSYAANSMGGVYLGVITYVNPDIPHNEGMYRPISVDLGPKGTLVNAQEPAACSMSTSVPYTHIAEAVRDALVKALPERAGGGWAKICMECLTGTDPRNGDPYAYLSHLTGWGGGGAFWGQDGEPVVGPIEVAGAAMTGDIETVEHMLPVHVHHYEFEPESAGAGRWRGGWGTLLKMSPVAHTTKVSFLGDGMKYPPPSVLGATSPANAGRVYRKYIVTSTGREQASLHSVRQVSPEEYLEIHCPGGGGIGQPFERDPQAVLGDVRSGLLPIETAREEYGVVIDPDRLIIDAEATILLRQRPANAL